MSYQHIVLAVELNEMTDAQLCQKAQVFAQKMGADLTLVHAIEQIGSYGAAYGVAAGADIEGLLQERAQEEMAKLGEKLGVPENRQIIKAGPAKLVILDETKRVNADLIILGSHGRHGLRLLLGSTANAVLHGAQCDVLAVRCQD